MVDYRRHNTVEVVTIAGVAAGLAAGITDGAAIGTLLGPAGIVAGGFIGGICGGVAGYLGGRLGGNVISLGLRTRHYWVPCSDEFTYLPKDGRKIVEEPKFEI